MPDTPTTKPTVQAMSAAIELCRTNQGIMAPSSEDVVTLACRIDGLTSLPTLLAERDALKAQLQEIQKRAKALRSVMDGTP